MIFRGDEGLGMPRGNVYKQFGSKCRLKWLQHKQLVHVITHGVVIIIIIIIIIISSLFNVGVS